jgi:dihydroorotase
MQREGMLLLVHGEVTVTDIDLFDREAVFIEQQLIPLRRDFPRAEDRVRAHHHAPRPRSMWPRGRR